MLNQDHFLMNRLMKLIIRYDKSKEKDDYDEILEGRKSPTNLMKVVKKSSINVVGTS